MTPDDKLSLRDIIVEAGLGRTAILQNRLIDQFHSIGIYTPQDFSGKELDLRKIRNIGRKKYGALRGSCALIGIELAEYPPLNTKNGQKRNAEFVTKRISTLKRKLAYWRRFAARKGITKE